MSYVKSPYNFVPAPVEGEVFTPPWADQVSHDIPFSDGESGEVEVEITAETPIFIRDGQKKLSDEERKKQVGEFSHYTIGDKKQYFIPATSIKGMVRNVLEIMSFSRLAPVTLVNTIFGLRDDFNVRGSSYKNEISDVRPGWLIKENDTWRIYPTSCDRITIDSICNYFKINSIESFKELSAKEKYEKINFESFLNPLPISKGKQIPKTGQFYDLNKSGDYESYLVMFGPFSTKKHEYLFHDFDEDEEPLELNDNNLVKKILDIESSNKDSLWHFFLKARNLKRVPVFFKEDGNDKVKHFGFSKLYRLNNGAYLKELSPISTYDEKKGIDLAQTIFGHVEGKDPLKGRIYFSHALSIGNPQEDELKQEILGSPKASYYPFYLKQQGGKYNTYQSPQSELRGFKKYHIHQKERNGVYTKEQLESDTIVYFKPLKSGARFNLKIRYHNLKSSEIGALLSALTYHGNHQILRHNLGMAKALGYGRVKFDVKMEDGKLKNYLKSFEELMNSHSQNRFGKKWIDTDQIRDLGVMAKAASENNRLNYPKLEVEIVDSRTGRSKKSNEFNEIKKMIDFLKSPSTYNQFKFKSLAP